ncbi:MAG: DNA polymerase III subunit alpha [Buchnera aphidicola (Periphyllus acericola)]|uniref:DNA polymerase III subunit alpha n=1 Tax=Buchnera aphidicola TaxID=9 RepID=UPI0030CD4DC3|nr:DNA polymerase III subunit alpha [Buchnera aphidicola (Periphyllus acericola)]
MSDPVFVHLRLHSDYSILDGLCKPEKIIKRASLLNIVSLGMTDFTNLYGVIKFYKLSHKNGIKPIIGADFNILSFDNDIHELTILACNNLGYENLKLLISKAYRKDYTELKNIYIKQKWLVDYSEGLILLSGGIDGETGTYFLKKKKYFLNKTLDFYQKYFNEHYYLEISRIGRINEEKYIKNILNISLKREIPFVATNNVRFIKKSDFRSHIIRIAIHHGISFNQAKNIFDKYSKNQFLKTEKEMKKLFFDIPEALKNSVEISKRCNVYIKFGKYFLPKFNTGNISEKKFLIKKSINGLQDRLKLMKFNNQENTFYKNKYRKRLLMELKIINKMGFPGYFLVVMEFIQWAKKNNIFVGPGRGSGAGSLVAFCLKITDINPIKFDLLFERFLNPERITMPDFDVDFCMNKRDLVIDHVSKIYGKNSVSQIITFGTMTAKAVIRDVGRALGYPYGFLNRISKLIPNDPGISLKQAFLNSKELSTLYKYDSDFKDLIKSTKKLEGVVRNVGKHAGGVVIAPSKITDFSPVYYDSIEKKNSVTQFDKNDIEDVGLVKFDFLGLKTLTIIENTIKMINKNYFLKYKYRKFSIENISLNDKKSFKLLKNGNTTSIFQLESEGIKDLIIRLKPDCFEEIVALVALFRPGPLQSGMVDNFIDRKHGREKIYYPDKRWQHKILKPILKSTYGIILYQEQVMKIAQIFSNYTLGEADLLRREISKKNFKEMSAHRSKFIIGAKNNNIDKVLSNKIFDLLEKFAGYGFNKSHSVAYALLSYQTLWLKSNYPAEFMASAMTMDMRYSNKIMILVEESFKINLLILSPNINVSKKNFFVKKKKKIVFGLGAIKGLGESTIEKIIIERKKNGNFKDLNDLCIRVGPKIITKKILEKLIFSGACDCFKINRFFMYHSINYIVQSSIQHINFMLSKQLDFFNKDFFHKKDFFKKKFIIDLNWSDKFELDNEKHILGFYLTKHPFDLYKKEINNYLITTQLNKINLLEEYKNVNVSGIIFNIKWLFTKNKKKMIILKLDDNSQKIDVFIFEKLLLKKKVILKINNIIVLNGFVKRNYFKKSSIIIAKKVDSLYSIRKKKLMKIKVLLKNSIISIKFFLKIKKNIKNFIGGKTILNISIDCEKSLIKKNKYIKIWKVYPTDNLFYFLKSFSFLKKIKKIYY